jgi:alpha-tubulin suppressor-like RCC1 family protein
MRVSSERAEAVSGHAHGHASARATGRARRAEAADTRRTAVFVALLIFATSFAGASAFSDRALVSAARRAARAAGALDVSGTTGSDRRSLAEVLSGEAYVQAYDLCPQIAAYRKCESFASEEACVADVDCAYSPDATDPWYTKYPCEEDSSSFTAMSLLFSYHLDDLVNAGSTCASTYDVEAGCEADARCAWDDSASPPSCDASIDATYSIVQGHPHMARMWDILQTCRTITDETLCGVGLTADKCQWLAAAEGGDTECAPTPAFLSLQLSCDCDNIEAAVPDLDYAGVVCDAPSAEFVLLSFDDVAYTNPHALVAPSNFHTCAVNATGVLKCWGKNEYGQLGIGITGGENLTANVVTGIDAGTVKELGAGNFHTVALLDDGTVKCWGYNLNGQCGVDTTSADIVNTPVTVPGLGPLGEVKAIGLGHLSTCAAMRTGGLMCWGMNQYGQLGDGTTTSRSTPAYVEGVTEVVKSFDFHQHGCALMHTGTLKCWGLNQYGQLGDGTVVTRLTPHAVSTIRGAIKSVSVGNSHSCVLLENGNVQCWGRNHKGQLGDGTRVDKFVPVLVSGVANATSLSAGEDQACASLHNGTVKCWGWGFYGQLGEGGTSDRSTPVEVQGITTAIGVFLSPRHSCAVLEDSSLTCWGYNGDGQVGVGSKYTSQKTPVVVPSSQSPMEVFLLPTVPFAPETASAAETTPSGPIDPPLTLSISPVHEARLFGLGKYFTCAVDPHHGVACWGGNQLGQLGFVSQDTYVPTSVPDPATGVESVVAAENHACALLEDTTVKCWGHNTERQLGDGTAVNRGPNQVFDLVGVESICDGSQAKHTCVVLKGGSMKCWGYNSYGQRGDGTKGLRVAFPGAVVGLPSRAVRVSCGERHTCAVMHNGSVMCWGYNGYGQLGDGTKTDSTIPVAVVGLEGPAKSVALGLAFSCALLESGSIMCWGDNGYGQLGDGTKTISTIPRSVVGITSAVSVSCGHDYCCAVLRDGSLKCWGRNDFYQLADATSGISVSTTPVDVIGIDSATRVVCGHKHACVALWDGSMMCWGYGQQGQLGTAASNTWPIKMPPAEVLLGFVMAIPEATADATYTFSLVTAAGANSTYPASSTEPSMMASAALAGDGQVVFPPLGTSVGVYDPSTGSFTTTGSMSGYYSYYAGASALDGRVIFAPYDTGAVGIFDPAGNVQVTTIDFTSQLGCSSGCFSGAVTADDGRVVMSPYNSQNVGVFNPTTNELATIVDGLDSADVRKFWGAAKAGTGAIVFVPYDANAVGVFHPHNDSVTLLPIVVHDGDGNVVTAAKFEGGATAHDGRVIFAPRFVDGIGAYDATSNSFELLFAGELTGRTGMSPPYFRGAAAAGDGRVLLTGASSATVFTILDTRDGGSFSFLDVSAEVGPESFVSGKFSGAVTVSDFGTVNQKRLSQIFLTPSAINGEMGIVDVEYSCGEMVNKAFEGCFPPEACTPCQEKLKARGHNAVPQCYVQVS